MSFGSNRGSAIVGAAGTAMNAVANRREDSEDLFAHTRMSLGDHIEDLRRHMIKALLGFGLAMIVGFFVSPYVLDWIKAPVEDGLNDMYEARLKKVIKNQDALDQKMRDIHNLRQQMEGLPPDNSAPTVQIDISPYELLKFLGLPTEGASTEKQPLPVGMRASDLYIITADAGKLAQPRRLSSLSVTEVFMVYLQVSMYTGFVLASPWIFYQMWMFVAAGLYPHERRYVHLYLPVSLGLFLAGVALCEFVVLPMGIRYLLSWNESMNVDAELRLNDWLSFAIMMPVIFGAAFQTPIIMFFIERVGIVDVSFYTKHRKMAIFILAVTGGLLSVSPDLYSMMLLVIPMWILYEAGILMCKWMPHRQIDDLDVPQSEELIEV
jgi:sec-independent protein translocase protein TatC